MITFPVYKSNLDCWLFDVVLEVVNGEAKHKCYRLSDGKVDYVDYNAYSDKVTVGEESCKYSDLPYLINRLIEERKYK
jgi:hypothetical protein